MADLTKLERFVVYWILVETIAMLGNLVCMLIGGKLLYYASWWLR